MAGNIVSFDIGSAQVKLVWLAGGACRAAAAAPVPDGLVRGGTIASMDAMADFLHQMAREHGLPRSAAAAVVLPPPLVLISVLARILEYFSAFAFAAKSLGLAL